jgi:hypothetical protein
MAICHQLRAKVPNFRAVNPSRTTPNPCLDRTASESTGIGCWPYEPSNERRCLATGSRIGICPLLSILH